MIVLWTRLEMYFVYLLKSIKNGKSYVGYTSKEVGKRLDEHNVGTNEWTRHNGPFNLVYYESYFCKEDAFHREQYFKSGVGKRIKKLIVENTGE
jgi:putative endonuclease